MKTKGANQLPFELNEIKITFHGGGKLVATVGSLWKKESAKEQGNKKGFCVFFKLQMSLTSNHSSPDIFRCLTLGARTLLDVRGGRTNVI